MAPITAARSQSEAFRHYQAPLRRALAAFAENVFLMRIGFSADLNAHGLEVAGGSGAPLRDDSGRIRLNLLIDLFCRIVPVPDAQRRWTVQTPAYVYRLSHPSRVGEAGRHIAAYYWHPHVQGTEFPHVHFLAAPLALQRLHVATPHCTLKHILTFAMRDFDVHPIRDDWRRALNGADSVLQSSMDWDADRVSLP